MTRAEQHRAVIQHLIEVGRARHRNMQREENNAEHYRNDGKRIMAEAKVKAASSRATAGNHLSEAEMHRDQRDAIVDAIQRLGLTAGDALDAITAEDE